jgi:hypothetical protein
MSAFSVNNISSFLFAPAEAMLRPSEEKFGSNLSQKFDFVVLDIGARMKAFVGFIRSF